MTQIIEILNRTSEARTVFYCFIFLVALKIITWALVSIFKAVFKRIKSIDSE
jgi:hypothetical protein